MRKYLPNRKFVAIMALAFWHLVACKFSAFFICELASSPHAIFIMNSLLHIWYSTTTKIDSSKPKELTDYILSSDASKKTHSEKWQYVMLVQDIHWQIRLMRKHHSRVTGFYTGVITKYPGCEVVIVALKLSYQHVNNRNGE